MKSWRYAGLPLSVALTVAFLFAATGSSRNEQRSVRQATPWQGPRGTQLSMAELSRGALPEEATRRQNEAIEPEPEQDDAPERNRPNTLHVDPPYEFKGVLPRAQPVTLSFTAFVGNGVPDTMGAIGPTQFLLVTNNRIKSFDKRTGAADGVVDLTLSNFFSTAGSGGFDPNVRYDRRADRWIIGALSSGGSSNGSNRLMFAVSDAGRLTRTTRWTFHQFQFDEAEPADSPGCSADFPAWGEDAIALYVTVGVYRCPAGTQGRSALFIIRKESLFSDGSIVVSTFRGPELGSGAPADDPESGGGTGYFVSAQSLCRVVDAGESPRLLPCVAIEGSRLFTSFTAGIRHRGNNEESGTTIVNGPTDNRAGRIHTPVLRGRTPMVRRGHIYYAMSLGVDNTGQFYFADEITRVSRLGIAWLDIADIDSNRPRLAASGRVFQPSAGNDVHQRNYWMPELAVSGQGHMMIGASVAGSNEYINAVAIGRLAGDAPGMFRDPEVFTSASAAYNTNDNRIEPFGFRRWGDYSRTFVDPCDDMTMWTVQQYTAETDKWGIAVARMSAPPPVTPATATPAVLPAGEDNVEVQLAGPA